MRIVGFVVRFGTLYCKKERGGILDAYFIGDKLKAARQRKNFTAEELAEMIDASSKSIWQLEGNKRSTTIKTLLKICCVLDVSLSYFLNDYISFTENPESEYVDLIEMLSRMNDKELLVVEDIISTTIKNRKSYREI